ncbi:hypothetical protein BS17DRAFT_809440, partial [Gyrodon lividus]
MFGGKTPHIPGGVVFQLFVGMELAAQVTCTHCIVATEEMKKGQRRLFPGRTFVGVPLHTCGAVLGVVNNPSTTPLSQADNRSLRLVEKARRIIGCSGSKALGRPKFVCRPISNTKYHSPSSLLMGAVVDSAVNSEVIGLGWSLACLPLTTEFWRTL